jgi:hypothetical protein
VATIPPDAKDEFEKLMVGNTISKIGEVLSDGIFKVMGAGGNIIIEEDISKLKEVWQRPLDF